MATGKAALKKYHYDGGLYLYDTVQGASLYVKIHLRDLTLIVLDPQKR